MRRLLTILGISTFLLHLTAPISLDVSALAHQDAASDSNGHVSYTSPAFGYTVSWPTNDWALEELSHWSDEWNKLELNHVGTEDSMVRMVGDSGFDSDPEACLGEIDESLRADEDFSELDMTDASVDLPATGPVTDAVALFSYTQTYTFSDPIHYAHLVACVAIPSRDAVLSLELKVPESSYESIFTPFETLAAGITFGGEADRSEALQGLYDATYTNPRWGFTVPLDQEGWTLQEIDHSLNYLQGIELEREASYAWIEAEGYDYETAEEFSPETCLTEAIEDFDDVEDADVTREPPEFVSILPSTSVSALVTYTLPDEDERIGFTDLIACSSMDGGRAVLSIWVSSYTNAYDSEQPAIQQLVSGISTPADDDPSS